MSNLYEVLRRPLITEKSNYQMGKLVQYAFEVRNDATKIQIKEAVESLFDVDVVRVNTIKVPAKSSRNLRNRRPKIRAAAYKKALITLAEGQTIDVFEGVK